MAAHPTTALRVTALLCLTLGASACSNPFSGLFSRGEDARPAPVPVAHSGGYNDGVEYPVRQPYPRAGDTAAQVVTGPGTRSVKLRADAPDRYTVVRGDTLWDISGKFLRDPWLWPEIWQVNDQIANPHLIYPGDVLRLVWIDGQPRIVMDRAGGAERLGPQIRVVPLEEAIDTIPYDAIAGFLSRPSVIEEDAIDTLPYVLDIKESHLVAGAGFTVYVRGTDAAAGTRYNLFHLGDIYRDPETNDKLGREALYVGTGVITQAGDPAKMQLIDTSREVLRGDRLMLEQPEIPANFFPSAPDVVVDGSIVSVVDGVQLIGQYQIVVLNRGALDGIERGQVLSIWQSGRTAVDRWGEKSLFGLGFNKRVELPEEQAGRLMVFKVDDQLSYGLVMSATSEISVGDKVRNPL